MDKQIQAVVAAMQKTMPHRKDRVMKRKITLLKNMPEQSRLAALEWAKSEESEVTTGCPYFLAMLSNCIYAGWLQKKGKDVSHIIPLDCQIDPNDIDCEAFDKSNNLIELEEFDGGANCNIFNQLLDVAYPRERGV
jgi:hypothetical protein